MLGKRVGAWNGRVRIDLEDLGYPLEEEEGVVRLAEERPHCRGLVIKRQCAWAYMLRPRMGRNGCEGC